MQSYAGRNHSLSTAFTSHSGRTDLETEKSCDATDKAREPSYILLIVVAVVSRHHAKVGVGRRNCSQCVGHAHRFVAQLVHYALRLATAARFGHATKDP